LRLRLRIQGGALSGRGFEFEEGPVRVGRSPESAIAFHPEADRAVSAIHAELSRSPSGWQIQDLGSRNGTFVNGERLPVGEGSGRLLMDGDVVTFGVGGPEARVELAGGTDARVRAAVGRASRRLKVALVVLVLVLAGAMTAVMATHRARTSSFEAERAHLLEEADRALSELASVRAAPAASPTESSTGEEPGSPGSAGGTEEGTAAEVSALQEALQRSERELRELRDALHGATEPRGPPQTHSGDTEALRRQLQEATAALRRQQLAGALDLDAVQAGNRPAVALVFVESATGEVVTGTAFAVRTDGTLLTVRHLVRADSRAPLPRRIAVQFSDSEQVWPARLVAESEEVDLAAIRVENITGTVPVVRGLNSRPDTLGTGVAVASVGFPLGGTLEGTGRIARPLVTAGVLSSMQPDQIEIHGYGEVGASGSPVFDAGGEVVGVLLGGFTRGSEQILLAVNSVQVMRFLGRIPLGR
jgi:pSer/pThr/pTyr-binding forkhead associated (FHA) protein